MKTNNEECSIIYCTFSSEKEAEEISSILVAKKLCACVNLLSPIKSIYSWQGKIESSKEVPAFIKTKKELFEEVKSEIKQNHSYETPCIIEIKITNGDKDYLNWLENSVKTI